MMHRGVNSLQDLPLEVLINICSFLEEPDILILQSINSFFHILLHDQEFWKKLLLNKLSTLKFPSLSHQDQFIKEFYQRKHVLNDWKHNKVVKNKYTINPYRHIPTQIEKIIFKYPRCYLYNDGIITIAQLNKLSNASNATATNRRSKFTYIPCTTPQGCSTMDFNLHAAVFGRFDGRVFAKLLTNKSFLQPVTEFNDVHNRNSCVTAINIMPNDQEGKHTVCVSGSESGELCWWEDTKLNSRLQLTSATIMKLFIFNNCNINYTISIDSNLQIHIILNKGERVVTVENPFNLQSALKINDIHFIKIDYGAMNLILTTLTTIFVISIDPNSDLGHCKKFELQDQDKIKDVYIDEPTALKPQDLNVAGEDGCYMAITLENNDILIINIRETLDTDSTKLRLHKRLIFNEIITACQINNVILAVTLEDNLKIIDPTTGDLLKTVPKIDKLTQFIRIFDNKIIITTGNNLNYYQFNPTHKHNYNNNGTGLTQRHSSKGKSSHQVSNKWNVNLNTAKRLFDEEEDLIQRRINENNRLLNEYGGDLNFDDTHHHPIARNNEDEEDINLRIALLESQQNSLRSHPDIEDEDEDEQLRRALEESQRLQTATPPPANEEDEELRRALELSMQDQPQEETLPVSSPSHRRVERSRLPLSHSSEPITQRQQDTQPSQNNSSTPASPEDEALALAIALSLSEIE
ncbi:ubiquitin ligase complex F-box protein Ufo1p [Monosporozyma servazzii]